MIWNHLIEFVFLWLYRLLDVQPLVWLVFVAAVVLAMWARLRFDAACAAGATVPSMGWVNGAAAAREILHLTDLDAIGIERARPPFDDDYDTSSRVLRLSDTVHDSPSVTAVSLAAEAVGHALQDRRREAPLLLLARDAVLIAVRLSWQSAALLFAVGLVLDLRLLMVLGLLVPGGAALLPFALIRLEIDAAHRARRALAMATLVDSSNIELAGRIIGAAFWRPVAAVLPRMGPARWRRLRPEPSVAAAPFGRS